MQNPQPVTFVYTTTATPNIRPGFACQSARALGIAQIVFGILLIVLQIASITYYAGFMFVGHGIWTGIIIIIAGAFGVAASKHSTTCLIVTFMVMSIIAAVFSTVPLSLSAAALPMDSDNYGFWGYSENKDTRLTLDCAMLISSLLEIVAAIWSSVICCQVLCCVPPTASTVTPGQVQVQYVAARPGGQQIQPINVVIAGPSGAAGAPQYMAMPGGYVQPTSSSGQVTGVDNSPPPAYGAAEVGMMTQGIGPPMEKKSGPLP